MRSLCYDYYNFVSPLVKHPCYSYICMLVVKKIVTCVDKLVVLLNLFLSPLFEAETIYMSRVSVWCLEYDVMSIGVISMFMTQPGW